MKEGTARGKGEAASLTLVLAFFPRTTCKFAPFFSISRKIGRIVHATRRKRIVHRSFYIFWEGRGRMISRRDNSVSL